MGDRPAPPRTDTRSCRGLEGRARASASSPPQTNRKGSSPAARVRLPRTNRADIRTDVTRLHFDWPWQKTLHERPTAPEFTFIGPGKKNKKKLHELRLVISPPFDDKSAILIANLLSFRQPPGPGLIDPQNNKKKCMKLLCYGQLFLCHLITRDAFFLPIH